MLLHTLRVLEVGIKVEGGEATLRREDCIPRQ
jgi:hypothetical protein